MYHGLVPILFVKPKYRQVILIYVRKTSEPWAGQVALFRCM